MTEVLRPQTPPTSSPPVPRAQQQQQQQQPPAHAIPATPTTTALIAQSRVIWDVDPSLLMPLISPDSTSQGGVPLLYALTVAQYKQLTDSYLATPLPPPDVLFPWLHGVDGKNYQQNLFFGVRRIEVPRHRGLTVVHADVHADGAGGRCRLMGSVFLNEILGEGGFVSFDGEPGINLRNFKIQVARYAAISDVVVYGEDKDRALDLAVTIARAQAKLKEARGPNALTYRTFVLSDRFAKVEASFLDLVSVDSHGVPVNRVSFWEQEREEMRILTQMSEVTPGVWVGNTADVPVTSNSQTNPQRIAICIESHDVADMPSTSTLTLAVETLSPLATDDVPAELLHLECLASGGSVQTTPGFEVFWVGLLGLLRFMENQVSLGHRILLHCADGYTETSLLVLSWLVYHNRLHLPDAYLHLQRTRSFFVYSGDLEVLKRIESKVWALFEAERIEAERRKRGSVTLIKRLSGVNAWGGFGGSEGMDGLIEGLGVKINGRSRRRRQRGEGAADSDIDEGEEEEEEEEDEHFALMHPHRHEQKDHRQLWDDQYISLVPAPDGTTSRAPSPEPIMEEEDPTDLHAWFHHPRFEGSFPSRILPNLYLGNLNHATNPSMLRALGITHVLSVGENASLPTTGPEAFKVLHLDNLYDDGIDLLLPHLSPSLAFVQSAISQNTGVLVHCRVGVSRSATITIAHVMQVLGKSLVDAYLFVRARRLNVIIQPNLKFMYELCQWEERLRGRRGVYWGVLCKEIQVLNMCYREV